MMVKRYVVQDMPEAIIMIRQELGKNAVILSTKKITVKKWLGLIRKKRIEVMAAAGEDVPIRTAPTSSSRAFSQTELTSQNPTPGTEEGVRAGADRWEVEAAAPQQSRTPGNGRPVPDSKPELSAALDSAADSLATVKEEIDLRQLQTELLQMKTTLQELLDGSMRETKAVSVESSPFSDVLRRQGLESDSLITELTRLNNSVLVHEEGAPQRISREHLAKLTELVPTCNDGHPLEDGSRVVAFVGQTGVGKTTTIAKIAALEMLSGRRRVGLITTDTYRIAAVEQLRTYARILDVPLEIVSRVEDLKEAVDRLSDRDLILIDTAGRNYGVRENFEEMIKFMESPIIDETHLVLSLASKPEDLTHIAERFASHQVNKFLFTKLDETSSHAVALELLYRFRKPVSYLTNGQNVPDDIEVGSLERLVSLILEGAA